MGGDQRNNLVRFFYSVLILFFCRVSMGKNIRYQKIRWILLNTDKFLVFGFQEPFEIANISRYPDFIIIKLNTFDQVVADKHH
jgi:hypothetical protein